MTAPTPTAPAADAVQDTPPPVEDLQTQQQPDPDPTPEAGRDDETGGELPDWARRKLDKVQREAQNLRSRLKEQEPLVAAAQEAERKNVSDLDRQKAENADLQTQLAQRDTELIAARYNLTAEDLEFIGEGTFEEKGSAGEEVRCPCAVSLGTTIACRGSAKPPTQRPVESLKPGASPTPPPAVDNSIPRTGPLRPGRGKSKGNIMANEAKPLFRPGADVTVKTTGAVTGKTFVAVSATPTPTDSSKAATAGAGVKAFGVAARNIASGDVGAILRGGIVNVTAGGAISVGAEVEVVRTAKAVTLASGKPVGTAVSTGANNNDVLIALDL